MDLLFSDPVNAYRLRYFDWILLDIGHILDFVFVLFALFVLYEHVRLSQIHQRCDGRLHYRFQIRSHL